MSETSQGPGWWLASDGKWYPPEAWTGPAGQSDATYQTAGTPAQAVPGPTASPTNPSPPGYGSYPGFPNYPAASGYGSYGYPGWQQGQYGYGHQTAVGPAGSNGLAIASLVCSCVGIVPFFFGIPCVLGIVFGFVARSQISRSNPRQQGQALALAGIIVGFSLIALFIVIVIIVAAVGPRQTCIGTGC